MAEPQQFRLPSHDQLVELARTPQGQARLAAILERLGITEPMEMAKTRAIAASQRLQGIPPGSPRYAALEREIIEQYANQELMGMTRYASQQYTSLIAADGNPNQMMVSVPEDLDEERLCEECAFVAGTEDTLANWRARGHPGNICLGGNRCR